MTTNTGDRELRDFVLRKLADEDRERLEEALFADDELFERLVEAEHDLIDEWARGVLPSEQKREVERVIGGSERGAERLRFSKTLVDSTAHATIVPMDGVRRRAASWVPLAAAAGVAGVVGALWFAQQESAPSLAPSTTIARTQPEPRSAEVAPVDAAQDTVAVPEPEQIAEVSPVPSESVVPAQPQVIREPLAFALSLATLRSGSTEPVLTLDDARPVALEISLDPADRFERYAIAVTGPAGDVLHREQVAPRDNDGVLTVGTTVPSSALGEGLHEVAVQADGEDLGWVSFRVRR